MARLRQPLPTAPVDASAIPAELLDHDSETWLDAAAFDVWHLSLFGTKLAGGRFSRQPHERFSAAVTEWAVLNNYMSERWRDTPDWDRLADIGIRRMLTLKRCQLNALHRERYGPGTEPWVTFRPS